MNYFDIFSIAYIVIAALGLFMGIHLGFLRSLKGLGISIISLLAAYFLCKPFGETLMASELGTTISTSFESFVISLSSEASQQLNATTITSLLPTIYSELKIPEFLQEAFTGFVTSYLPSGDDLVEVALPIAQAAAEITCILIAFLIIVLAVYILYWIILLCIKVFHKATKTKPSAVSRLLGGIIKLAEACILIYGISVVLLLCSSMQNDFGNWVTETLALNDDTKTSIAKYILTQDWLFGWLFKYLGK
ncbi:MAG: hypothetical protein LKJ81_04390 [Bacilli bacterium]|jgi:hypothetical protein|nr:hypothetical protein [Bacilli bacterium]MCH4277533.1 hypothetical protein [Bacilli bacterium]MCI2055367.1 hypothetical protein [Bacilli bacterium]